MKILVVSAGVYALRDEWGGLEGYGGAEQIAWDLACGLAVRGHLVTLAAPHGSTFSRGKILHTVPPSLMNDEGGIQAVVAHRMDRADPDYDGFDVVLDHTWARNIYRFKERDPGVRIVSTIHNPGSYRSPPPVRYPCLVSPSRFCATFLSGMLKVPVRAIHHGIDLSRYQCQEKKQDYYLCLARICAEKGVHELLAWARRTRKRLVIAGDDQFSPDKEYILRMIREANSLPNVEYLGGVSQAKKIELLRGARGLLHAPLMPYMEIFGLSMVEALACGTPVVALRNGAIPEVVGDRSTGIVVDHCGGLDEATDDLERNPVDPRACRARVERFFSLERMVVDYEVALRDVVEGREW